ncbi:hypothetical protein AVEN_170757-1, partial [Araneus ventricosus]
LQVLVILTSRFEATRGLLWDGPPNFEQRSDDENDTPSPNFHATPTAGPLANTYDLRVYAGDPGWVERRHFFRTLTAGKVTSPNPAGGTRMDPLACSRPHAERIFIGIGFRTWHPPAHSRDLTTRPPRPYVVLQIC